MKSMMAISLACFLPNAADARTYDEIMADARAAFVAEDFGKAAVFLDEAQDVRPYSLYLTRNRILARILTDRMDEAIKLAAEVADRGLTLDTPPHEAFDRMRAEPSYGPVAARMAENAKPKGVASIKADYAEAGLLPEAISTFEGRTLIGSVRTGAILAAAEGLTPFALLDGGVFDIEQRRNAVYAAVNNQLAYERRAEGPPVAAIVELDPKTGVERRRTSVPDALFGDIEVSKNGSIFASDSLKPRLFIAGAGEQAREFATDNRWANLQGIALDETGDRLFVADYLTGLYLVDARTGAVSKILNPTGAHLGGIDGLYLYKGDLIGIQNGVSPQRIVRIDLDKSGGIAKSLSVLQQALPEWNEPTHGFIGRGKLEYIATSNWPAYDDDGSERDGATLAPLRILTVPLKMRGN